VPAMPRSATNARRRSAGSARVLAACVTVSLIWGRALDAQSPQPVSSKPILVASIQANGDARVQGGDSAQTKNYPAGDLWLGLPDKTVFLHFDLASLPAGAVVNSAELVVTFRDTYSEQGSNTIELGGVQGQWRETGVTYANQPSVAWSGRTRTVSGPGPVSFDAKPAVVAWLSGTHANRGFALRGNGPLKNAYSREAATSADRPTLRIKYIVP
jgi:hypothetical protein